MERDKQLSFVWWLGMVAEFILISSCECMDHPSMPTNRQRVIMDDENRTSSSIRNTKERENSRRVISQEQLQSPRLQLFVKKEQVTMTNGIVNVTLSVPDGLVTKISYNGIDNLLASNLREDNRGYWDMNYNKTGVKTSTLKLLGTSYKIIEHNDNQTEISFVRTWNASHINGEQVPLNVDKRFVMLRGSPGLYTYAVFERLKGWSGINIEEARVVFKLQENKFHYMAMSDERQRVMPTPEDRRKGKVLDYPEAVLLTKPTNPDLQGEVDDKYLYSCENKDNKVHGWISSDHNVGFWMITPSNEFRTGGPFKQDLTSHVGPTVLSMFVSRHYAGEDLAMKFQDGEPWKKVFGPVFVYLNSYVSAKNNPSVLWNEAKTRMLKEVESWPYTFPYSKDYIQPDQRGGVRGQLLVQDWYINEYPVPAANAYVGLAAPGPAGSWQRESKGYQFWTKANSNGQFVIEGVIGGSYNLYAWVPGRIGDYKYESIVNISPGSEVKLNGLVYKPPRYGATLWEIGVPDRTAAEFNVPDPSPSFKIHTYNTRVEKFRQYGLWSRYAELYPRRDLVYTVGSSNYTRDWFYAHVTRKVGNNTYRATTWKILFDLKKVIKSSNYTLQVAIASATGADLQVRFNDPKAEPPHFRSGLIGSDNAVARHGIHGLYRLYTISVTGDHLTSGRNAIFLTQSKGLGPFKEVMYDYIRFEGPMRTH